MKRNMNMKSMRGVTLIGILFIAMIVIFVVVIGMNIIPTYTQHLEVKDILDSLAKDPATNQMNKAKVKDLFERRLQVNSIRNIKGENLDVEKKDGKTIMTLNYEVRTHLMGNMDVIIKFNDKVLTE